MENKHTFAICAYKESSFFGRMYQVFKEPVIESEIFIITSTPNSYIDRTAEKYGILYM